MAKRLTIKTFHAFGAHLLRRYGESLGLPSDFAIAGESDRLALLRQTRPNLSESQAARCADAISSAKNRLVTADAPEMDAELAGLFADGEDAGSIDAAGVYRAYDTALRAAHLLDFDDLLLLAVRLCEEHAGVLDEVRATYRWISVDEYQDVNLAQYRLLRLLAGDGANLCVIGDPDQAIYGFRGSDPRFIESAARDFPGITDIELSRSYRCPGQVLRAGGQVLQRDGLLEGASQEMKINIIETETERSEADWIAATIESLLGGTRSFSRDSGITDGVRRGRAQLRRLRRPLPARCAGSAPGRGVRAVGHSLSGRRRHVMAAAGGRPPILDCLWLLSSRPARRCTGRASSPPPVSTSPRPGSLRRTARRRSLHGYAV